MDLYWSQNEKMDFTEYEYADNKSSNKSVDSYSFISARLGKYTSKSNQKRTKAHAFISHKIKGLMRIRKAYVNMCHSDQGFLFSS